MNPLAPENIVGVHIGNPLLALRPQFAPAGNYVAYFLLHRMLELALLREGLTLEDCCGACGGELNDCIFIARVTDPVAAADVIKRELGQLSLDAHCQIGVREESGWRCIYPSSDVRMDWLMDTERLEHALAQCLQAQSQQFNCVRETVRQLMLKRKQQGGEK